MNKIELINKINDFILEEKTEELIKILNDLILNDTYKDYLDIVFSLISSTQMYGFIAYFSEIERKQFLEWDKYTSFSYSGNKMDFYNSGQLSLLYELEKHKKVFLSAPTSFGKTSLVIEYIINNYNDLHNILLIVPTNSLIEELYIKMKDLNKVFHMNYFISTQPYMKDGSRSLLILTPERFLMLNEDNDINLFDLVMMDETYKIVDFRSKQISDFIEKRSLRFRKVADIIAETKKRLILLSPFTYESTDSMNLYLNKYHIKRINRRLEYVNRRIIDVSDSIKFKMEFGTKVKGYQKSESISKKCNYLLRQLNGKKNIIYVSNYTEAYRVVMDLEKEEIGDISERFKKFLNHLESNYLVDNFVEWKIITALKKHVGIYISPLPRYIKKEMIKLYEDNELDTLIVTTAFTEGVNTSASNLIFTTLVNGPSTNKLSDIDILNVSGRAGRFAKNSYGNVYCITKLVYDQVMKLQESAQIRLENYNYVTSTDVKREDYELDMIDDEYLSEEEKNIKKSLDEEIYNLGLRPSDFYISLNVPTRWKLDLYSFFKNNIDKIDEYYDNSINLLDEDSDKRIESLEKIFKILKESFDISGVDGFHCQPYEIKAFDNDNGFTWGRLYSIYSSDNISKTIKRNKKFIENKFSAFIDNNRLGLINCKKSLKPYFKRENMSWVLDYYHDDLTINIDKLYTETFKFISSIIQYKIPFYVTYFVSILKLFIQKNNLGLDLSQLDIRKISLFFEDGNISNDYSMFIDFGIPNIIISKIQKNHITVEHIKNNNFDLGVFDEYEQLLLDDFKSFN